MAKRVTYRQRHGAVEDLWRDRRLALQLRRLAEDAATVAASRAPKETGALRASYQARIAYAGDGRPIGRAYSDLDYALRFEMGSSSTNKFRPLGTGIDSLQGRLR